MKQQLRIGELAKLSGVKAVTIRYYEQAGLLPAPVRTRGNYRCYSEAERQRLQFIRRCRELGFTLAQVRDLLRVSAERSMPCGEVKRIASLHRRAIEEKLRDLRQLHAELRRLSTCCAGECVMEDCGILEALSAGGGEGNLFLSQRR